MLRWLQRTSWMRPYQALAAVDSPTRIRGQTVRIRAELQANGAQAVATIWVRYREARVAHVVSALHRAGYARAGHDHFERRLYGRTALLREGQRFEQLKGGVSFESWPARKAERVEVLRHGRPYSPVVSALARIIARPPWTPLIVAASVQRPRGPILVAWTIVLDDEDADWFEIGLQLGERAPKGAKRILQELNRDGFRDGLGNVTGVMDGVLAMPRRSFRDLATWRVALRRVRTLVR